MKKDSGNVLFLILIAVALFAALSYVVTSSTRTGRDESRENRRLDAAGFLNLMSAMEMSMQRMMVMNKVADYQIDFFTPVQTQFFRILGANPNCLSDKCRLYYKNGGGMSTRYDDFIKIQRSPYYGFIHQVAIPGFGSDAADIVVQVKNVTKDMCNAINEMAGLGSSYIPNVASWDSGAYWAPVQSLGTIEEVGRYSSISGAVPSGKKYFCTCYSFSDANCYASDDPSIWYVLLER